MVAPSAAPDGVCLLLLCRVGSYSELFHDLWAVSRGGVGEHSLVGVLFVYTTGSAFIAFIHWPHLLRATGPLSPWLLGRTGWWTSCIASWPPHRSSEENEKEEGGGGENSRTLEESNYKADAWARVYLCTRMEDVEEEGLGTKPSPCFQENPQESRRVYKTFDGCERVGVGEESHSDR